MQMLDLLIKNGRVIDPESHTDAQRHIGVTNGKISVIEEIWGSKLQGIQEIDATGLIVSPGFIDLHSHGQDIENYKVQAMDGVTTALELEIGTADVDEWYDIRKNKTPINYGVSSGHIPARISVMEGGFSLIPSKDAAHRPAKEAELKNILETMRVGLKRGGLAVGFGLQYTPAASRIEIIEAFKIAKEFSAPCHVHIRGMGNPPDKGNKLGAIESIQEVIANATITGAALHIVHISSVGLSVTENLLEIVENANLNGLDITTECYPYSAGMTLIESAIFDEGWQENLGVNYENLLWPSTGEVLNKSSFEKYRSQGGMVVVNFIPETSVIASVKSPLTSIATDGWLKNSKGHPRTSGSYAKLLGEFVRENKDMTLMDAIRKSSLMPAQRLEQRAPDFLGKGRIKVGADADICIFDPGQVIDNSTYSNPSATSVGFHHVIVGGVPLVIEGVLKDNLFPGKAARAPII
ncbi:MAG: dihydroorotase [Chloroflexi bacterium]|jgi:hypothetical protein|nr:MAG: dihydroorotase [Chloroflexota bacterium]